jgi:hypothetical protein
VIGVDALAPSAPPSIRDLYSAVHAYGRNELRTAGDMWRASQLSPETPYERMLVAATTALVGSPNAPEALDALARERPGTAHLFRAQYFYDKKQPENAVAELEQGFDAYRGTEWIDTTACVTAFDLAAKLGADPTLRPRLLAATARPLTVRATEGRRLNVRVRMTPSSDPACVGVWGDLEPNVDWDRASLTRRYECYYVQHSPLATRAMDDLTTFLERSPSQIGMGTLEDRAGMKPAD